MARTPEITPDIVRLAREAMRLGMTNELACQYIGISRSSFYRYLARGQHERGTVYRQFWDAISQGRSQCAAMQLARIQQAAQEDWRAAAWVMERRFGYHRQLDIRGEIAQTESLKLGDGDDLDRLLERIDQTTQIRERLIATVYHEDDESAENEHTDPDHGKQ